MFGSIHNTPTLKWLVAALLVGAFGQTSFAQQRKVISEVELGKYSMEELVEMAQIREGQSEFFELVDPEMVGNQSDFAGAELESGDAANESALSAPIPTSGARSGGGVQRAMQESDIFKVGKPNSKLLYLLNNHRGLQVVSFADGANKPKLLGRVEATGNYPDDMYYDAAKDQLIVIESKGHQSRNSRYTTKQSRIVVYDVSTANEPKISEVVEIDGRIADSRIVGDILYIAGSIVPNYQAHDPQYKGVISSYSLSDMSLISQQELVLPGVTGSQMNIIEVEDQGKYSYYLTATRNNRSSWWSRQTEIELIDITSAKGDITPLMVVSAKGHVDHRSNTTIKDGNLVVVSNYTTGETRETRVRRVAVEAFAIPEFDQKGALTRGEVITEDEAEYRRLHIARQIKDLEGEEKAQRRDELVEDPILGLKGRFVKEMGTYRKIFSDDVHTVGDSNGLSANLRDVRYVGDKLYVFWVPQNNIDPFDLYDLSALNTDGINYLKRLQFDGWIDRAIPLSYDGKEYVLGLGWVVEVENNETNRRRPQAKLFELSPRGAKTDIIELGTVSLDENTWANFNTREDKFIELRLAPDYATSGRGSVMFQAYTSSKDSGYMSGGKLIDFDIKAAVAGEETFSEGAFLVGEAGWLRRVFTNSEIDKINTFTDMQLSVYDTQTVGSAKSIQRATGMLELARNIESVITVGSGQMLQVIKKGYLDVWQETSKANKASVELRQVSIDAVDAELSDVQQVQELQGEFVTQVTGLKGDEAIIVTMNVETEQQVVNGEKSQWHDVSKNLFNISKISVGTKGATSIATTTIVEELPKTEEVEEEAGDIPSIMMDELPSSGVGRWVRFNNFRPRFQMVRLGSGELVALTRQAFYRIDSVQGQVVATKLSIEKCGEVEQALTSMVVVNDKLVLNSMEYVEEAFVKASYSELRLAKRYASVATLKDDVLTCGPVVNIAGVIKRIEGDSIVTQLSQVKDLRDEKIIRTRNVVKKQINEDGTKGDPIENPQWPDDYEKEEYQVVYLSTIDETALTSFSAPADTAELRDMYISDETEIGRMVQVSDGSFAFFEYEKTSGRSFFRHNHNTEKSFISMALDKDLRFERTVRAVKTGLSGSANIVRVIDLVDTRVLVVASDNALQMMSWEGPGDRPEVLEFTRDSSAKAQSVLRMKGVYFGWMSESEMNFSVDNSSLEIALGLKGVTQLKLAQ